LMFHKGLVLHDKTVIRSIQQITKTTFQQSWNLGKKLGLQIPIDLFIFLGRTAQTKRKEKKTIIYQPYRIEHG